MHMNLLRKKAEKIIFYSHKSIYNLKKSTDICNSVTRLPTVHQNLPEY